MKKKKTKQQDVITMLLEQLDTLRAKLVRVEDGLQALQI